MGCISFEHETGKWNGLRWLAGNWGFGETVRLCVAGGTPRLSSLPVPQE